MAYHTKYLPQTMLLRLNCHTMYLNKNDLFRPLGNVLAFQFCVTS